MFPGPGLPLVPRNSVNAQLANERPPAVEPVAIDPAPVPQRCRDLARELRPIMAALQTPRQGAGRTTQAVQRMERKLLEVITQLQGFENEFANLGLTLPQAALAAAVGAAVARNPRGSVPRWLIVGGLLCGAASISFQLGATGAAVPGCSAGGFRVEAVGGDLRDVPVAGCAVTWSNIMGVLLGAAALGFTGAGAALIRWTD
jgi:hypothetical protein